MPSRIIGESQGTINETPQWRVEPQQFASQLLLEVLVSGGVVSR